MASRNATLALPQSAAPPPDIPSAARARSCATCRSVTTCAIARYTFGEVEICSLWEERRSAA